MDRPTAQVPPRAETFRLPPDPTSPATARYAAAALLTAWGLDDLCDTGLLLLSEIATNAVRHAGTAFDVAMRPTCSGLRVDVTDEAGSEGPVAGGFGSISVQPQVPAEDGEGGRGLLLVDALASRWGVDRAPHGSVVWFELDRPAP